MNKQLVMSFTKSVVSTVYPDMRGHSFMDNIKTPICGRLSTHCDMQEDGCKLYCAKNGAKPAELNTNKFRSMLNSEGDMLI